MTDTNTAPAGDAAEFSATSIADAIGGTERHSPQETHVVEREPGVAPEPAPAPAAPPAASAAKTSAQAAPPAPAPAADARDPDAPPANAPPKWYRDHMAKTNRELAASRQENERLRSGRQPPPQPRQDQQPEFPDPIEDPRGYHSAITADFNRRLQQDRLEQTVYFSEVRLRDKHGDDTFAEVQAWFSTRDANFQDWCASQRDPWFTAYKQYQSDRLVEEIGDDPEAYKKRLREEWEAEIAARQEAEPQHIPAGRSMTPARATPPAPASTARSASGMERDGRGRFQGQTPMGDILGRPRTANGRNA